MIIILGIISGIVALISTIFGIIIGLNVLNSKSDISEALFTDEQKVKVYWFRLFMISFILFIESFCIFTIISIAIGIKNAVTNTEVLGAALFFAAVVFILSIFSLGRLAKWYQNFFIKHHYKFRVSIPNIGYLYIIGMLNTDMCICSKDPNVSFKENSKKTFLVPVQSIVEQPIIKIKFPKPYQSNWKKFFK